MDNWFRFQIALQTIKDNWKTTLILTLLFMGIAVMYSGLYPSFKDSLNDILNTGFIDSFKFIRGAESFGSYVGFLNIEMYQIFWILILGILIGFISASYISKEIEGKTGSATLPDSKIA